MDSERLRQIITAYGGHPDRWPDDERDAALALLHDRPELLDLQRSEQTLDEALDQWPAVEPSSSLIDAVLPQPMQSSGSVPSSGAMAEPGYSGLLDQIVDGLTGWLIRPIAAIAVACSVAVAGFSVGFVTPEQTTDDVLLASEVSELMLPGADLTVPQ